MTDKEVCRYINLVDRRVFILSHSGVDWKPEYAAELESIDRELAELRRLVDEEHGKKGGSMESQESIFEELKREAEYAQRSFSTELLYQAYGKALMARQLEAITKAEFMEINTMTIRFMNTDHEYIHRKNMACVGSFSPENDPTMTLTKIIAMGLTDNSTEIYVRHGGARLGILAHGNRNSDEVLNYANSELEYFTWHEDNEVYIDLKEEEGQDETVQS